jgi:hypothetical protein
LIFDKETAYISTIFLALSPLFISTSINPNLDLPSLAFILMSFYFYIKEAFVLYAILGTAAVMTKEISILWVLSIFFFHIMKNIKSIFHRKSKYITSAFIVSIPIIVLILWMIGNKINFNWFLFPRNNPLLKFRFNEFEHQFFIKRIQQIFLINFNWIFSVFILIYFIKVLLTKSKIETKNRNLFFSFHTSLNYYLLIVFLFFLSYIVVVSPIKDFILPRYAIVLHPFLFMIGSYCIKHILKNKKIIVLIIFLICVVLILQQNNDIDPVMKKYYFYDKFTGSEMEYNLQFTCYITSEIEGFNFLRYFVNDEKILFDFWNPLHAMESSRYKNSYVNFGYNFNSSWNHVWIYDFLKKSPEEINQEKYFYFTHKIGEPIDLIKNKCALKQIFYKDYKKCSIYIYKILNCY